MGTAPTSLLSPAAADVYGLSTPQAQARMREAVSNTIISLQSAEHQRAANRALYAKDSYAWAQATATLIRIGQWYSLDPQSLIEEVESVATRDYHAVSSAIYQILVHLLKWRYQPTHRSPSWRVSLVEHRNRIPRRLRRVPSLEHELEAMLTDEYRAACHKASAQTGLALSTFPETCPWTIAQVRDMDFWPAE